MEVGYRACERAHEGLVAKGLKERDVEEGGGFKVDRHGKVGTLQHMMAEREAEMIRFKERDTRKTKWREESWLNLAGAAGNSTH